MAKISYQDIFDFSNPAEVQKAIKAVNDLNKVYLELEKNIASGSKTIQSAMNNTVKSADSLEKEIKQLQETKQSDQKQIQDFSNKVKGLNAAYEAQKSKLAELSAQEKRIANERKKVAQANQQLTAQEKERLRLEQQLAKATSKDAVETAKLKVQIQEANKASKERAKEALGLVSLYQKESQKLNDLRKRYKEVALAQGENSKQAKALRKESNALDKKLKDLDSSVGQNQRSVGSYGDAISNAIPSLGALRTQILAVSKALTASPIGLIVTAVVALGAAFLKTQQGADSLKVAVEFVTAVFDELVSRVAKLGSALVKFISFDFKGAAEDASAAIDNIGESLLNAGKAAAELARERQEFRDREREINKEIAQNASRIQDLIIITRDRTKAFNEQRDALRQAAELEIKNEQLRVELAQKRVDFAKQEIENSADGLENQELLNSLNEAEIALLDAQAASRAKQREILNRQVELENRITSELKRRQAETAKLAKNIDEIETNKGVELKLEKDLTKGLEQELEQQRIHFEKNEAEKTRIAKEEAEKRKVITETSTQAIGLIGNQLFTNAQINSENELTNFRRQKEVELELAGENAQARAAIEEQIAQKERQAKIKQAKAAKAQALFNIGINTADSILKVTAQTGIAAPFIIPSIIALGLLQASLVASQPLPQFEDGGLVGTNNAIITSEKGYEYAVTPSGRLIKTGDNGAEIRTDIPKGSFVIPHDVSKALDQNGLNTDAIYNDSSNSLQQIIQMREEKMANAMVRAFARENDILAQRFDKSIKQAPKDEYDLVNGKIITYTKEAGTRRREWRSKNKF